MSAEQLSPIQRIYQNIQFLLQEGAFPGKYAEALAEAQKFVAVMAKEIQESVSSGKQEQPAQDVRSETNAGRVGGGRKSGAGRKNRKDQGNRTGDA